MPVSTSATTTRRAPSRRIPAATQSTPPPDENVRLSDMYYSGDMSAPRSQTVTVDSGRVVLISDTVTVSGTVYHRHSPELRTCPCCRELMLISTGVTVVTSTRSGADPQTWCPACHENHTWECDECEHRVSSNVSRAYNEDDDEDHEHPLCPSCRPRESSQFGRLLNYSDRTANTIPPEDTTSMLFGLEVETHVSENRPVEEAIKALHRIVGGGYYVTKHDGSLENGFEIVTRPDSMRIHREKWLQIFEAINSSDFLKKHLRSWSAPRQCCGIHCHIDKSMLSQMQLGKLNVWLNHPNNRAFIEKVAGRGSNSFTSFKSDVKIIDGRRLKTGTSPERYVALNVTQNTAEMRIFRGTLNPEQFYKILDFVEASVEWTGLSNCSAMDVSNVSKFAAFVHGCSHRYPFLLNKLVEWKVEPAKA